MSTNIIIVIRNLSLLGLSWQRPVRLRKNQENTASGMDTGTAKKNSKNNLFREYKN